MGNQDLSNVRKDSTDKVAKVVATNRFMGGSSVCVKRGEAAPANKIKLDTDKSTGDSEKGDLRNYGLVDSTSATSTSPSVANGAMETIVEDQEVDFELGR